LENKYLLFIRNFSKLLCRPAFISTADRFLLVGDPYQLLPLVVSPEARIEGMDISLMKRLSDSHPEVVSHLTLQYRMNSDILSICNSLYYDHRMKCANDDVSNLKLQLLSNWQDLIPKSDWLSISLDPANSVVFLDTSRVIEMRNIGYYKDIVSSVGNKLNNTENCLETEIIFKIMESMIICGIDSTSIGIISPFRAQLSALLHRFQNTSSDSKSTTESFAPCEISTIDKYQGRDKDVVIFSTVRSSQYQSQEVNILLLIQLYL
jgi:DNA replication ATP-dependent helicase Dna2